MSRTCLTFLVAGLVLIGSGHSLSFDQVVESGKLEKLDGGIEALSGGVHSGVDVGLGFSALWRQNSNGASDFSSAPLFIDTNESEVYTFDKSNHLTGTSPGLVEGAAIMDAGHGRLVVVGGKNGRQTPLWYWSAACLCWKGGDGDFLAPVESGLSEFVGAVTEGGRWVVVGEGVDEKRRPVNWSGVFDLEEGRWASIAGLPSVPKGALHYVPVSSESVIRISGSLWNHDAFRSVYIASRDDDGNWSWEEHYTTGDVPGPRQAFTALSHEGTVVLYGGDDGWDVKGELYLLEVPAMIWTKVSSPPGSGTPLPSQRERPARQYPLWMWVVSGCVGAVIGFIRWPKPEAIEALKGKGDEQEEVDDGKEGEELNGEEDGSEGGEGKKTK